MIRAGWIRRWVSLMAMRRISWTDQRIDQLKTLWEKGLTASQIADEPAHYIDTEDVAVKAVFRINLGRSAPN